MPGAHCRYFFGLLGGGQPDSGWNRSGMTPHRLAILPGVTNYDLNVSPTLAEAVIPFPIRPAPWTSIYAASRATTAYANCGRRGRQTTALRSCRA